MATDVLMPKLGLTMEEGTITAWLALDGSDVEPGQPLFVLETDKVETEVHAEAAGRLHHLVAEGATVVPGTVVGHLAGAGDDSGGERTAGTPPPARAAGGTRVKASPHAKRLATARGVDLATVTGTGPGGRIVAEDVEAAMPAPPAATGPVLPSPVVRRLAAELGVDLDQVAASGAGGRITRDDVLAATPAQATPGAARPPVETARPAAATVPMTTMRRIIATRMHQSLQATAQLSMTRDVDVDEMVRVRAELAEWLRPRDEAAPTYTDFVMRATALALRDHPLLNATLHDDRIECHSERNIGMAVALEGGLVVPVIRAADTLSLRALATESARLAAAARSGRLGPDDLAGVTFSVTSLGMHGIDMFTPIINPPNVAILGVGRVRTDVRWSNEGRAEPVQRLTLSLTIDHRAVDGAPGAEFLTTVAGYLEHPARLLAS